MVWQLVKGEEMMICQLHEMVKHGAASSIMRTGRVYAIKRTEEDLRQRQKWLMNRAFQREHWKMPKRSLVSGRRKLTIHGIGS